jgi:agmatinase
MRLPHVTELRGVDAAAIGVPFDTAVSFRSGARFGPEAIRSASALLRPYHPALEVDVLEVLSVVDYGDLPVAPGDTEGTYQRVEEGLAPLVAAGVFSLVLGGDHSITLAELRALSRVHGPLALVHFDAHTDTWDEYFDQRYFHGTTFRRAAEEGLIEPAASVQAGMRGSLYAASDLDEARALGFTVIPSEELRALGPQAYARQARTRVGGPAGVPLLRHRLPRPRLRAGHRHARGGRLLDRRSARPAAIPARDTARRLRHRGSRPTVRSPRPADRTRCCQHRARPPRAPRPF